MATWSCYSPKLIKFVVEKLYGYLYFKFLVNMIMVIKIAYRYYIENIFNFKEDTFKTNTFIAKCP